MNSNLITESFRWYGPRDVVTLNAIRQCGARGVYTALHEIPYGEVWPIEAIRERKALIERAGLEWVAVEAVSISEAIKAGTKERDRHIDNYRASLRALGQCGVDVVLNCFMPVFEWVRTDFNRRLPDGKTCLAYDPVQFAAFDVFTLQRETAAKDYPETVLEAAEVYHERQTDLEREAATQQILSMLPGFYPAFTLEEIRERVALYADLGPEGLRNNLEYFLKAVMPVAEEAGVRLAMHPDDPPFPIFGLPRILSTEADFATMLRMVDSPANGIALCSGSLGARADNDLPGFVERLGPRIHALHLRNVRREREMAFYESDHLEGSVDMPALVKALLNEQARRRAEGRPDWRLSFRPDHGHVMLDDLEKPPIANPGYTLLGRMRGLAELRGIQRALVS